MLSKILELSKSSEKYKRTNRVYWNCCIVFGKVIYKAKYPLKTVKHLYLVTLFLRAYYLEHFHDTLFSWFSTYCTKFLIHVREILVRTLFSRLCDLANLHEIKVLTNKRSFTVFLSIKLFEMMCLYIIQTA